MELYITHLFFAIFDKDDMMDVIYHIDAMKS